MLRKLVRSRFFLPSGLVVVVATAGLLAFGPHAGASGSPTPTLYGTDASVHHRSTPADCRLSQGQYGQTGTFNAGSPFHTSIRAYEHGCLVLYGSPYIKYALPSSSLIPEGDLLFQTYCSTCHGPQANGPYGIAPNLQGLGPATVDFWITTGRMPAQSLRSKQAPEKTPKLTPHQALAVAAWVNSLLPAAPFIPHVQNPNAANLADGASLYTLNCAACHTITGAGDALAYDTYAPTLHNATITQVVEAIRTGPANMPRFTGNLTDQQVRDIAVYVTTKIQKPQNIGGWGLGGVGPVTEGFVALLFGVGILMLVCYWIGDRS